MQWLVVKCCLPKIISKPVLLLAVQDDVGIRHGGHCQKIVDHLEQYLDRDAPTILRPPSKQLTLCVEGNISTGKSSFLNLVGGISDLQVCT